MRLGPRARKAALTAHIASSVGWLGLVAAFAVLDVTTVASDDPAAVRSAYIAMDALMRLALVPVAVTALATGILVAAGGPWGLFRHYWVVVSLVLTALALVVMVAQGPLVAQRAALAAGPASSDEAVLAQGHLLLHSVGGAALLLFLTALNVAKPRGLTRHGWRREQQDRVAR